MVTVEPTEIRLSGKANEKESTVTAQIAHTRLASEQTVTLAVGTFRTASSAISPL
jgi:hypothetical protein